MRLKFTVSRTIALRGRPSFQDILSYQSLFHAKLLFELKSILNLLYLVLKNTINISFYSRVTLYNRLFSNTLNRFESYLD